MSIVSGTTTGVMGAQAAGDAADAQVESARLSNELQLGMFLRNWYDMKPFREAGYARIPYEQRGLEDYERIRQEGPPQGRFEDSDYYGTLQSSIGQAATALQKQAAARGGGAGSIGRDLAEYAVPLAGQQRGQWEANELNKWLAGELNPAASAAQVGGTPYINAAGQMAGMGQQTAAGMGQTALYGGQAQASGYLGRQQATSNAIGGGANALGQMYGMYQGGGVSPYGAGSQFLSGAGFYDRFPSMAPGQTNTGMLAGR